MPEENTPKSGPPPGPAQVQVVIDPNATPPTYYANAIQIQLTENELILTFALGIPPAQGLSAQNPNIRAQVVTRVLVPAKSVAQLTHQLQITLMQQTQLLARTEEAREAAAK